MALPLIGLGAIGLGAGVMYLLDPARGRRRRSQVMDQITHGAHISQRELGRATRDLSNRMQGLTAMAGSKLRKEYVDDDQLISRVRSKIGRAVSRPGAIEVLSRDGSVRLRGRVPATELDELLSAVQDTRGVLEVHNELDIIDEFEGSTAPHRPHAQKDGWAKPANRLLSGLVGAGLVAVGARRGGILGTAAKLAGAGVTARAVANRSLGNLVGLNGGSSVKIQKTISIDAPVDTVFRFWSNSSNFPRFMSHIEQVRDLGDDRSHWIATGPGGYPVEWTARTTQRVENKTLKWDSEKGSAIENKGAVNFESQDDDSTRVSLHMTYNPPAGLLGHTVASILGVDPKHQIDEDLMRMKSLIELGKTTAHHKAVTREELESLAASD